MLRAAFERLGNVANGLLVALERAIGRQRQSPRRARRDQRPVVLEERDVLLDRSERALDRRRRLVDVDLDVVDRKPGRLEQIQRRAHDELRLARLDLDERVDDRVELELVRAHDLRARGGTAPRDSMPQVASREVSSHFSLRSDRAGAQERTRVSRRRCRVTRVCDVTSRRPEALASGRSSHQSQLPLPLPLPLPLLHSTA